MGVRQLKVLFFIVLENILKLHCTNKCIEALSYFRLHLGGASV